MPGNGITESTLDSFHVLFSLWPLLVVEKLFLKMKIMISTLPFGAFEVNRQSNKVFYSVMIDANY